MKNETLQSESSATNLPVAQRSDPSFDPNNIPSPHRMPSPHPETESCFFDSSLFRLLDASANRAGEGLRVVEDYVRFVLDDRLLTETLKRIRHDLSSTLAILDRVERCAFRETVRDVGTTLTTPQEKQRGSTNDVLIAAFERIEQSLRSLEEFLKLRDGEAAISIEAIRYRVYTLEKVVVLGNDARNRLAVVRLCVLVDGQKSDLAFERLIASLVESGATMIQLRDKILSDRELVDRGRTILTITRPAGALFIMNDRPDLAAACRADGVHLGQDDLSIADARRIVGACPMIGVSTHTIEQARRAVFDGASYIGVGPTFHSSTKSFDQFPGLELIEQVAAEISLPTFAIGGITPENLDEVLAAGATRVAIASAIQQADDPSKTVTDVLQRLRSFPS